MFFGCEVIIVLDCIVFVFFVVVTKGLLIKQLKKRHWTQSLVLWRPVQSFYTKPSSECLNSSQFLLSSSYVPPKH